MPSKSESLSSAQIETIAHKRAAARLGWTIHAGVYLSVNLGLFMLALAAGRHWTAGPALAWGLGLLVHGAVVSWATPGAGLYQKMVRREVLRLQARRDPW